MSGSASWCVFRRADDASGCWRAECRMLVSQPGKTGLIYFVGPFCGVSAGFISVPFISGSWFRLISLFQGSGSFFLLPFSLVQVQLLLFGCLDLTTVGHLTIHRWPSLSQLEGTSNLLTYFCRCPFKTTDQVQVPSSH